MPEKSQSAPTTRVSFEDEISRFPGQRHTDWCQAANEIDDNGFEVYLQDIGSIRVIEYKISF